ncbi:MAG: LytTR family DNA-binding domain-containing protein [Rhodobacteraceae bacterium]|nr:LytTR family DNA-binding domain-containing protein [Paracoccaceae bacterium]
MSQGHWGFSALLGPVRRLRSLLAGRAGAEQGAGGNGVVLHLLLAEMAFAAGDDLGRVFRHRYVLLHYLGLSVPVFLAFLIFNPTGPLHTPYLPSIGLGIVMMMATVSAYVWLLCWGLRRLSLPMRVPLTPGLLLGAQVLMLAVQFTGNEMGVTAEWSVRRSTILVIGFALYLEAAAMVVLRGPAPRALGQLRAEQRAAQIPPVRLAAEEAPTSATTPTLSEEAALTELRDLLRLEAQGNFVLVVTASGRHVLPGPFSARVARLADHPGWQVHRSHWVAARAVVGVRRSGRRTVIETADGAEVLVAGAQAAEIRAWAEAVAQGRRAAGMAPAPPMRRGRPGAERDGTRPPPGQGGGS